MRETVTKALIFLAGIVAVTTLPLGILSVLYLGWVTGVTVFVVGWLFAVPLLGILATAVGGEFDDGSAVSETESESAAVDAEGAGADPLETLRERYAAGELTETEFERRVERLLETDETVPGSRVRDDASEYERDRNVEYERDRDVEYETE